MATTIIMPKLGLTMTAGAVAQWTKEEGERVAAGDVVVEVMTEKITYQVEAQAAGVLLRIVVEEGEEEVPCGTVIGVIGEPGEDISALLAPAAVGAGTGAPRTGSGPRTAERGDGGRRAADGGRVPASPAARKLAAELGVDLAGVAGTGPGGRITTDDVQAALEAGAYGTPAAPPAPTPTPATPGAGAPPAGGRAVRATIPYAGVRRAIGEHMAASRSLSPTVTHHARADVHELAHLLARANEGRADGERISFTAALVKATAAAIAAEPTVNATLHDDVITVWADVNIGVAVAVPDGLVVPVVRNADTKDLEDISREVADLAGRTRAGRLSPDEVTGGTFTITNVGGYGSVDWFTPIINQPEAAILGVGRVRDEVTAVDGVPAVRPMVGLSLTFDHRIIDGAPAAAFLRVLLDHVETPHLLLE